MDQTEQLHGLMPLCGTLGMRVVRFGPHAIELEMDWTPDRCTSNGLLHGGALMALADSAGGACAFTNLPEGATGTSTIESKTNFLGAVRDGAVRAVARPLHIGSTTIVVETEVRDGEGHLVMKTTQTQIVLKPRSSG
jgi:1,4-dihydroxy-2-naphthoyl-CoA hydrolase